MGTLTDAPSRTPTRRRLPLTAVVAACLMLGFVSLVIPAAIGYDPWAWLVWGREVAGLRLDTTSAPSWKPGPVVVTTLLAPLGSLAPPAWLVLTRALGLLAVALTYRLAARVAGGLAGTAAVVFLVLTPDPEPRFVRLLVEGHTGLASGTLTLLAVERHLDGRHTHALLAGTGVALLRPEAWPFLGLYAVWLWWSDPERRGLVVAATAAVPVLWFGGDWWGSGDPWHGADAAQVAFADSTNRTELALRRFGEAVAVPVWIGAAAALVTARRRRERVLVVLGGGALAWMALVVAMTVVMRYAALGRFFVPGATVLCVLGGIGTARAIRGASAGAPRAAVTAVALVLAAWFLVPRAAGLAEVADGVRERARVQADLAEVLETAGGADAVRACAPVTVDGWGGQRPALAWHLDLALSEVDNDPLEGPGVVFARSAGRQATRLAAEADSSVVALAERGEWVVYAVGCPTAGPSN